MKIIIDLIDDREMTVTDETLNNPNYIVLLIGNQESIVDLDQLYQALKVFIKLRED